MDEPSSSVRRVRPDDWELIKRIRLEMLADSPDAYITTLDEASAFPDELWMERAERGAAGEEQATFVGIADDGAPVAMAVGLNRPQGRTKVLVIVSVFVTPSFRGTSLAPRLMMATETWGAGWGAPRSTLWVAETNPRARAFYRKIGYRETRDRMPMVQGSPRIEIRLQKRLKA